MRSTSCRSKDSKYSASSLRVSWYSASSKLCCWVNKEGLGAQMWVRAERAQKGNLGKRQPSLTSIRSWYSSADIKSSSDGGAKPVAGRPRARPLPLGPAGVGTSAGASRDSYIGWAPSSPLCRRAEEAEMRSLSTACTPPGGPPPARPRRARSRRRDRSASSLEKHSCRSCRQQQGRVQGERGFLC